jgi:CubicO group peptidase (beta-lactamase class C family)
MRAGQVLVVAPRSSPLPAMAGEIIDAMNDGRDGDGVRSVVLRDRGGTYETGDSRERQPVFSITKMFIAVACLRLSGRRLLDLDEGAQSRLPAAPAGVTVRELLSHTAGLADYPAAGAYQAAVAAYPAEPWDLEQVLAVSLAQPRFGPGQVRYCNAGYWMLGAILERVTRTSLPDTLAAEVFGPAGMTDTAYPDLSVSITADGYSTLWAGPAGAVWSTARDLDMFLGALLSGTLLTADALTAMCQATPIEPRHPWPAPGYGLGLMTDQVLRTIGHGGSGPGYQAAAFTLADGDRSAVVIAAGSTASDPVQHVIDWLRPALATCHGKLPQAWIDTAAELMTKDRKTEWDVGLLSTKTADSCKTASSGCREDAQLAAP